MDKICDFKRVCNHCQQEIQIKMKTPTYEWQKREFCSLMCLCTHIDEHLETCSYCKEALPISYKTKFCVRFGSYIEQFCSSSCLESFKTSNSFCKLCQERIFTFMLISEENKFCSPFCVSRYNGKGIKQVAFNTENTCVVCKSVGVHHYEMLLDSKSSFFCSKSCVTSYSRDVFQLNYICQLCGCILITPEIYYYEEGQLKSFCSSQCANIFIFMESELFSCCVCNVSKASVNMIRRCTSESKHYFCSMYCLYKRPCLVGEENSSATARQSEQSRRLSVESTDGITVIEPGNYNANEKIASASKSDVYNLNYDETIALVSRVQACLNQQFKDQGTETDFQGRGTSVGTQYNINRETTSMQTEKSYDVEPVFVPFPVYIPTPVASIPQILPVPIVMQVPIPIPVPIPILGNDEIPSTSKSIKVKKRKKITKTMEEKSKIKNRSYSEKEKMDDAEKRSSLSNCSSIETVDLSDSELPDDLPELPDVGIVEELKNSGSSPHPETSSLLRLIYDEKLNSQTSNLSKDLGAKLWKSFKNTRSENETLNQKLSSNVSSSFSLMSSQDRNLFLISFLKELTKGGTLAMNEIIFVLLCIQYHLNVDSIFTNIYYQRFSKDFFSLLGEHFEKYSSTSSFIRSNLNLGGFKLKEEMLWEAETLGSSSPSSLLYTVFYFNTKSFFLCNLEDHENVKFKRFVKLSSSQCLNDQTPFRLRCLRYLYPKNSYFRKKTGNASKSIVGNMENSLRCPFKLNEFYASKCTTDALASGTYYLSPILGSCAESKTWFSMRKVPTEMLQNMLNLTLMVEEIQISFKDLI